MSEEVVEESGEVSSNWYDGFEDEVNTGTAQNKGWSGVEDVVKSYRELETHVGAPPDSIIKLPEDPDSEAWGDIYNKLGRPEEADGYVFDTPEGQEINQEMVDWFKQQAHDNGMSASQAENLFNSWNEFANQANSSSAEQTKLAQEAELSDLKNRWGDKFSERVEHGRRVADQFGVDNDTLNGIENSIGTAKILELFAKIGDSLGEDSMVETDDPSSRFGASIEQHQADKRALVDKIKANPERLSDYVNGKGDDYKRIEKLDEIIRNMR